MYIFYEIMRIWLNFLLYYALNAYALIMFKPRDESAPLLHQSSSSLL